jgi:hypothetical protein
LKEKESECVKKKEMQILPDSIAGARHAALERGNEMLSFEVEVKME